MDATFEEIEASVEEVRDLGDTVLALGRLRARFWSGVALDSEIGWLTPGCQAAEALKKRSKKQKR